MILKALVPPRSPTGSQAYIVHALHVSFPGQARGRLEETDDLLLEFMVQFALDTRWRCGCYDHGLEARRNVKTSASIVRICYARLA